MCIGLHSLLACDLTPTSQSTVQSTHQHTLGWMLLLPTGCRDPFSFLFFSFLQPPPQQSTSSTLLRRGLERVGVSHSVHMKRFIRIQKKSRTQKKLSPGRDQGSGQTVHNYGQYLPPSASDCEDLKQLL